jgi:ketosteroid isomerase-like protein
MSQKNVEVVRHAYEAWNQREYTTLFAVMDPEVEFVLPESGMNRGTHRGLGEVRPSGRP